MKIALVLGATGLTGSICITKLLNDERYSNVIALSRSPLSLSHGKLTRVEMNEQQLESIFQLHNIDEVFCCLGTTIKKAGGKDGFIDVDKTLVLKMANNAHQAGVGKFVVISALGANAKALSFYNRVKGEMEHELIAVGFKRLIIVRPSLILGPRKEHRKGEDFAKSLYRLCAPVVDKLLPSYRPVPASALVQAMINSANQSDSQALTIIENQEIFSS